VASVTLYTDPWESRWTFHARGMRDRTFHWVRSDWANRRPGCRFATGRSAQAYRYAVKSEPWREPQGLILTLTQMCDYQYFGRYPVCPTCMFLVFTAGAVPVLPAVDQAHFWV
jgi:hypothetical protein